MHSVVVRNLICLVFGITTMTKLTSPVPFKNAVDGRARSGISDWSKHSCQSAVRSYLRSRSANYFWWVFIPYPTPPPFCASSLFILPKTPSPPTTKIEHRTSMSPNQQQRPPPRAPSLLDLSPSPSLSSSSPPSSWRVAYSSSYFFQVPIKPTPLSTG